MKIAYNWLKEYIDISESPEELSAILTDIGLEVEGLEEVETVKGGLRGVIVGETLTVEQHTNADKLKVISVNIGEDEPLPIVCGAPNVAVGQKVLVATVGSTIYPSGGEEGIKIKKAKIRGEESQGMICAEDELGLGKGHDGILVLDDSAKVGTTASEQMNIDSDFIIEIGLTPNRADAVSHMGVARDLAAYYKYHGKECNQKSPESLDIPEGNCPVEVDVQDSESCPKYTGVVMDGLTVKDSPDWLKNRLLSIGIAPINNVVDVTNFVLHETGHPLHAFDKNAVGDKVIIRKANQGEKMTTLDDEERELHAEDLMIANSSDSMCIAGVFGGATSGVSIETESIFLESAWFDPISIRKSSKRHALHTDASFRYERGVDPNLTEFAMKRAAKLLVVLAGGKISGGFTRIGKESTPNFSVGFNPERARILIGEEIADSAFEKAFEALEMKVKSNSENWEVSVPPYRVDVQREADLVEDFLRIHGFNAINIPTKVSASMAQRELVSSHVIRNSVSNMLAANGFNEILNNSLTSSSTSSHWDEGEIISNKAVSMLNPLSNELNILRQSMVFGMLESAVYNQNRQHPDVRLFEFGKIYNKESNGSEERYILSLLITGDKYVEHWKEKSNESTFFTLKKYVDQVLKGFSVQGVHADSQSILFEEGISYVVGNKMVAQLGVLSNKALKQGGLKQPAYYAELFWDELLDLYSPEITYKEVSKFPAVKRDLSLLISKSVRFVDIRNAVTELKDQAVQDIQLFDVYEGKNLEDGKKSYAISLTIQDDKKTLTDKRVDGLMKRVIEKLESDFNAELR